MTEAQALEFSLKNGKYAGKPFKDVPQDYLQWLVANTQNGSVKTAAELTLQAIKNTQSRKPTMTPLDDDSDIPF